MVPSSSNGRHAGAGALGDFTTRAPRLVLTSAFAVLLGAVSAGLAKGLLAFIAFFTNLFFFQRASTAPASPAAHHLGPLVVLVPVAGALVVGLLARFGSERIRGHGIPEAIESILINGSKVEPKLALLKPISAAVSIGSGGPFGAEGPIILTGGAFGSLLAQLLKLSAAERKTLLVAGAAAGMSATFAAPLASVLLAVELLLFEWKPRSFVPVALASVTAAACRRHILGMGPLFPVPPHPAFIGWGGLLGCVALGLAAGALSALLTRMVYLSEDAFLKLPVHWMWWPAIGGVVVGLGGLVFPEALGVGYDTIGVLLTGDAPRRLLLGVLLVKSVIWAVSLGSGTSGGVLAPLLMMGAALGGVFGGFLPPEGAGFWPLVGLGAILGGTMRSPFTGVVFALELTHDVNVLLPLLLATALAHAFTVLSLKRSILTEKVARRGFHLSREYAIDPLEVLSVKEVMRSSLVVLPAGETAAELGTDLHGDRGERGQHLYPVVNEDGSLAGVLTRRDVLAVPPSERPARRFRDLVRSAPVVAYPDEPLRVVVYRMAETGLTCFPVVDGDGRRLLGLVALKDLLKARSRRLEEEERRERVLLPHLRFPLGGRWAA